MRFMQQTWRWNILPGGVTDSPKTQVVHSKRKIPAANLICPRLQVKRDNCYYRYERFTCFLLFRL